MRHMHWGLWNTFAVYTYNRKIICQTQMSSSLHHGERYRPYNMFEKRSVTWPYSLMLQHNYKAIDARIWYSFVKSVRIVIETQEIRSLDLFSTVKRASISQ